MADPGRVWVGRHAAMMAVHGSDQDGPMTSFRSRAAVTGAVVAVLAWCGWVSGFHRATTAARVTWAFSLAGVVAVDLLLWQGRHRRHPGLRLEPAGDRWPAPGRPRRLVWAGVSPWLVLMAVAAAWDALGIDTGRHRAHLTISALTQAFRPMNAAMLLVWMAVGVGYGMTRARTPLGGGGGGGHRTATDTGEGTAGRVATGALVVGGGFVHQWRVAPAVVTALLLPDSRAAGVAFWLVVVGAAVVVDQLARRSGGRVANAEQFLRLVTSPRPARIILVLAWAYAGYHLFAH